MRFHLSEEHVAIQDAIRGTLADCWPIERLHKFVDDKQEFDPTSWQQMMELGLGAILEPDSGMGLVDAALACEAAGQAAAAGPLIGQMLAVAAVSVSDNQAAKSHLEGLSRGDTVASVIHEGSPYAPSAARADLFLVVAESGAVTLFESAAATAIEPIASTDVCRPFSKVTLTDGAGTELLAPKSEAGRRIYDAALVLISADALGGAQKCIEASVSYAKEREQFGQPIGQFQAVKHQLAQMALEIEPARALLWYAAHAWDARLEDAPRSAAMVKAHLTEIYVRATRAAIAVHGGIGYTWECGLNYWFRRAVADRAWFGSPPHHRARAADIAGW